MSEIDIIGLAKGNKTPAEKKPTPKKKTPAKKRKPVAKKPVAKKKLTPQQVRDAKAAETVNKLLEDSPINLDLVKKEDVPTVEQVVSNVDVPDAPKGVDWLEEQITALTAENKQLRIEKDMVKADYQKLFEDKGNNSNVGGNDATESAMIRVFCELQDNYIRRGFFPSGKPRCEIHPLPFIELLVSNFPFLNDYMKV